MEHRDQGMAKQDTASAGAAEVTDEVLLERFTSKREEAAFAALVERHGSLVLGACRRVLQHEQDAEDAFQAVFCVLARRAGSIRQRGTIAGWLHSVASRIAWKARAKRGRQPVPTSDLSEVPAPENSPEWDWRELRPLLDAEVDRLPEKYRQAFILCYLEGRTNEQIASQLGCPPSTVRSRLTRARERLRGRLLRRGLTLSATALAAALGSAAARAAVPPTLTQATLQATSAFITSSAATGALSSSVSALAEGFLKSQTRARLIRAGIAALAVIVTGTVLTLLWPFGMMPVRSPQTDAQRLQGTWSPLQIVRGGGQVLPGQGVRLTFAGDRCTLTFMNVGVTGRYELDVTRIPKVFTLYPDFGGVWPGIYQVEGNSLKLCINSGGSERPTEFAAKGGESVILYVLDREASP